MSTNSNKEKYMYICYSPLVVKSAGFETKTMVTMDLTKTIIPLSLMASESIAHLAFSLMDY